MKEIASSIRILRRKRQMPQAQLAQQLGVQYQTVSKWENAISLPVTFVSSNSAPALTGSAAASANAEVGSAYTLDLGTVFSDADNDALTNKVSVNGAAAVSADKVYSYTPDTTGTTTLVFTANDGKAGSPAYTVTLNVETAKATNLYDRCTRNPALYPKWNELAGEVIEKF